MKKILFAILILSLATLAIAKPAKADFVCPVFNSDAVGQHNPNAVQISNGDYTIIGPDVNVPDRATNMDGSGNPAGNHARPGDANYSPIWNTP